MTTRYERLKMQRRMQRRIRLVVEERRMAFGARPASDPEETVEIPAMALPQPAPAIGRVRITSA
ncbi:hypothetical protein Ade02nite_50750 [Paractinoplanes deccanensis]|uniref:Uncharacterized protein n=1 Tax=Paractinoplanes deccanensis TaxID=113561 RepID=A0ABQ3Y8V9_9ACTN|nr:hypothetical protein [Actinoplanes deccanensis]GID76434.1 hypothetical protein Ade02nite_50750 [Actinoplanes deccanensis]